MKKTFLTFGSLCLLAIGMASCDNKEIMKDKKDAYDVPVDHLSPEMEKVRDYVPKHAVIAHRGSTFWTPEETEAAYRWAREMGADYLEADIQVSKDGVILALHDDNLKRTTDIENVYGETLPKGRKEYYLNLGYTEAEANELVAKDKKAFVPYLTSFYTYEELLKLDAGTWFNLSSLKQARKGFTPETGNHQYISALEDMIMYSRGMKLKRDQNGDRVYKIVGKTGQKISTLGGEADVVKYKFEYVAEDANMDSGHRPGIYIEFKESWLNPADLEQRVYDLLDEHDMNIITKPEAQDAPYYINEKVNINNTNGKVILQTFSLESLVRASNIYKGRIPMCFLLWKGNGATDISDDGPLGYASFINLGVKYKAHIMGPSIAGAPNDYPELNAPFQDFLIKRSGMLNHPYSFDSHEQMAKYFGDYNFGNASEDLFQPPYMDGAFTNRTEMTLQFYLDKGVRHASAAKEVPSPEEVLVKLGYSK